MPKELIDGIEYVDGQPVEFYQIRFTGPVYVNAQDAAGLSTDDLVTFMVTARLGRPVFKDKPKTGEQMRVNPAKVLFIECFDQEQAKYIYDNLGKQVEGVNDGIIETPDTDTTGVKEEQFEL